MVRYSSENLPPVGKHVTVRPIRYLTLNIIIKDKHNCLYNKPVTGVVVDTNEYFNSKTKLLTKHVVVIRTSDGNTHLVSPEFLTSPDDTTTVACKERRTILALLKQIDGRILELEL